MCVAGGGSLYLYATNPLECIYINTTTDSRQKKERTGRRDEQETNIKEKNQNQRRRRAEGRRWKELADICVHGPPSPWPSSPPATIFAPATAAPLCLLLCFSLSLPLSTSLPPSLLDQSTDPQCRRRVAGTSYPSPCIVLTVSLIGSSSLHACIRLFIHPSIHPSIHSSLTRLSACSCSRSCFSSMRRCAGSILVGERPCTFSLRALVRLSM